MSVQRIDLGIDGADAYVHEPTGLAVLVVQGWIDGGHVAAMERHGYALSDVEPEDVPTGGTAFRFTSVARHVEEDPALMSEDEFLGQAEQYVEAERALALAVL